MVGCYTAHGITRVGTTGQEVAARALSITHYDRTTEKYSHFVSDDGGMTWRPSPELMGVQWSEGPVDTPRGTFHIEGPDIVQTTLGGVADPVFSAASWRTSSNLWFQEIQTNSLKDRLNKSQPVDRVDSRILSKGPVAIAYDPGTGNVIAATGIMGAVVGTPDGQWRSVAVGEYTPVEFSRIAKLKTLISHNIFWATIVTFPFLMIALAFCSKAFTRGGFVGCDNPEYDGHGDTTIGLSHGLLSQPESSYSNHDRRSPGYPSPDTVYENLRINAMSTFSVLFLLVSLFSLAFMWVLGSGVNSEGWIWWPAAILAGASILASVLAAWRGHCKVHWGGLAGSCLAMAVFVALPFVIWAQTGLPLAVPKTLAVVLCVSTAIIIYLRLRFELPLRSKLEKIDPAS